MIAPKSPGDLPPYAKVKKIILDRIRSGDWQANHRVPSENELVSAYKISKMTANRALTELAREGELVRVRGIGSFVAAKGLHPKAAPLFDIAEDIRRRNGSHDVAIIVSQVENASPLIADAFGLAVGSDVYHSLLVHHEDSVSVQIEDRFVNPQFAQTYLDYDLMHRSPAAIIAQIAELTGSHQVVEAVFPQRWERKLLGILTSTPVLSVQTRAFSGARVVSVARFITSRGQRWLGTQ